METAPTTNGPAPSVEDDLRRRLAEAEARREQLQDALRAYRELFEFAPDAYVITDLAGVISDCNHAFGRLLGRPSHFLVGKPLPFVFAREDRTAFYRRLIELRRQDGGAREWEARLDSRPDATTVVALTVTGFADAEGRAAGFRWLMRDISARKAVEDALRAEKTFAEGLIEAAQAVVVLADAAGRLLRTNAYMEHLTGHSRDELLGGGWLDRLLDPAHRADVAALLRRTALTGVWGNFVLPLRTRRGESRVIAWAARPVRDLDGLPSTVLAVGHDITELQEAQERALRSERLAVIGQVMTGLAHESRNILQRAQASLERLTWRLQDHPETLQLVRRAQEAQEDLVHLYEDVRGFAAPIRLNLTTFPLSAVWREVWADLTERAPGRRAELKEDAEGIDLVVEADRFRIGQVFRNLMENALAACRDPVRVTVSCWDVGGMLLASVRDNGPGFSPDARRRLFEPFVTTKTKGTGLGLAICRRIVEAHGGQMEAGESDAPGAEILFTLPRPNAGGGGGLKPPLKAGLLALLQSHARRRRDE